MVSKEIQRGFYHLKDSKEAFNYFVIPQTRQISGFLVGINFTRFFMLIALSKGKLPFSIFRVTLVAGSEFSYIHCQQREAYFPAFNQNV